MKVSEPHSGTYMVVFTSRRKPHDSEEYSKAAQRMVELAKVQPGFLGVDSARSPDGLGITVSYWQSEDAILNWKNHLEHEDARNQGRAKWYEWFDVKIGRLERAYGNRGKKSL